ncbi:MAG: nodulation protein NfeD [Candidatus Marinimicrobia bacterium]|nr:nodulation protein NfeD [Candidatus Neomarinimicrobiota bacterium]MCF7851281.1 nodulation protein NfeD [Candidatus Neomarinimicrobiota bacterium]MCF7904893.1 nodulation protein NfeD [Candidatus Neomarinimicrobiota bacterium]
MLRKLFILLLPLLIYPQVYILEVKGTIDMGLAYFFERQIPQLNVEGGDAIILDIDTFGGRVDAATMMKNALLNSELPTIAFINTKAISAGSLISLACDTIVMRTGATMGATTVVDAQSQKAGEKAQSYMREEMAATAESKGRNPDIAMAMVDESIDIDTLVLADGDTLFLDDVKGAQAGKLLTLRTSTAMKYGMADYQFDSIDEILGHFGYAANNVEAIKPTWSEVIVRFLTDPIVSSLLMTIGFLGLIFEIQSPGWGIPGTFGLIALILFFSTSVIADLASMVEILFLLGGIVLIGIEAFVIPGFGVVGIFGIGLMIYAMFTMLLPSAPTAADINAALWALSIAVIGGVVGLGLLIKRMLKTKAWQRISLATSETLGEGYSGSLGLEELVGKTGVAVTKLRPSGTALVDEKRIDVVTFGDFIEQDAEIVVKRIDGNRIVVEKKN